MNSKSASEQYKSKNGTVKQLTKNSLDRLEEIIEGQQELLIEFERLGNQITGNYREYDVLVELLKTYRSTSLKPNVVEKQHGSFKDENEWKNRFEAVSLETRISPTPWLFHENIIKKILETIADGEERILLEMPTGTGKTTIIPFQIAWKLFHSRWNLTREPVRHPRILFLTHLQLLEDPIYNSFAGFEKNKLVRIGPDEIRDNKEVPKNASIFITNFKTFMSGTDENGNPSPNFGDYPPEFFDMIIVDEFLSVTDRKKQGHRKDQYHAVIDHFASAVLLALTSHADRSDRYTYALFGESIFQYTLGDAFMDGKIDEESGFNHVKNDWMQNHGRLLKNSAKHQPAQRTEGLSPSSPEKPLSFYKNRKIQIPDETTFDQELVNILEKTEEEFTINEIYSILLENNISIPGQGSEMNVRARVTRNKDIERTKDGKYRIQNLHNAITHNTIDVAQKLIENGADVNKQDKNGRTPLHVAARRFFDITKILLEKNSDVNKGDKFGRTPLQTAATFSSSDIAKILLENGADVNKQDENGNTALHRAGGRNLAEIVKILLEHGADVNKMDKFDRTPLHRIIRRASTDALKILLEHGADVTREDKNGSTPLHIAGVNQSANVAKVLIEHGADVNKGDKDGRTPLHIAANNNSADVVKLLLENGADVKRKDKDGSTPFQIATLVNAPDVAKVLFENGADVNERNENE